MPLKLKCPQCRKALTVPDQLAGRMGKCPGCGASVSIPASLPPAPAIAAAVPILTATLVEEPAVTVRPRTPTARPKTARQRSWKFWLATAAGGVAGLYMLSMFWGLVVTSWHTASAKTSPTPQNASRAAITSAGTPTGLPFRLADFRSVLGPAHEENAGSLLYSGSMKISTDGSDITVAFNAGTTEGLFYAAGLFRERVFQYPEGDEIMDQIDNIGYQGRSKRFRYRIEKAKVPLDWRQVRFMPLQ